MAPNTRVALGKPRLATAGFTTRVKMCLLRWWSICACWGGGQEDLLILPLMKVIFFLHPNPSKGMTKIKAFVAFQCLRSWSMALRCFNFRITICNFNLITFSGGGHSYYLDEEECEEGKKEDVGKNDNDHRPRWSRWGRRCWRQGWWAWVAPSPRSRTTPPPWRGRSRPAPDVWRNYFVAYHKISLVYITWYKSRRLSICSDCNQDCENWVS